MNIQEILKTSPNNGIVKNNLVKAYHKINDPIYSKISCAISGGQIVMSC